MGKADIDDNRTNCLEENQPVLEQLDQLRALEANWDGYGAEPIDGSIIDVAHRFICSLREPLTVLPQVIPMSQGRVQLEWHKGRRSLELEFESPRIAHYLKWDPTVGIEEEDVLPLTEFAKIRALIKWFEAATVDAR